MTKIWQTDWFGKVEQADWQDLSGSFGALIPMLVYFFMIQITNEKSFIEVWILHNTNIKNLQVKPKSSTAKEIAIIIISKIGIEDEKIQRKYSIDNYVFTQ